MSYYLGFKYTLSGCCTLLPGWRTDSLTVWPAQGRRQVVASMKVCNTHFTKNPQKKYFVQEHIFGLILAAIKCTKVLSIYSHILRSRVSFQFVKYLSSSDLISNINQMQTFHCILAYSCVIWEQYQYQNRIRVKICYKYLYTEIQQLCSFRAI